MAEQYERLRAPLLAPVESAGRTMTLAARTLIDHGMHAWIEAFASRVPPASSPLADLATRPLVLGAFPQELIGALATLVSNRRTPEVMA